MPPQPTMSPCPSTLQLSPSVCLRLLCLLLLLTDCSSSVTRRDPVPAEPLTRPNATQGDVGGVGVNATHLDRKTNSKGKPEDHSPPNSSSSNHTFNDSITHPPNQQPASPDHQGPPPVAVPLPFTTTGSSTQAVHTGPITSATTPNTTEHVTIVHTTTFPVTSQATTTTTTSTTTTSTTTAPTTTTTSTTTAASTTTTTRTSTPEPTAKAAEQPATTAEATTTLTKANTSAALPTTAGAKTSPPSPPPPPSAAPPQPNTPSTGTPPVQTSLPRGPTTATVTSTGATADRDKTVASGTRVAAVDVAGDALTSQLVDTASLLAVLLFGLLFFLVTVAVFVTQAYESYRRKDYTQVDYLINGMYSDSGV